MPLSDDTHIVSHVAQELLDEACNWPGLALVLMNADAEANNRVNVGKSARRPRTAHHRMPR